MLLKPFFPIASAAKYRSLSWSSFAAAASSTSRGGGSGTAEGGCDADAASPAECGMAGNGASAAVGRITALVAGGGSTDRVTDGGRLARAASKGPLGTADGCGRGTAVAPGRITGTGLVRSSSSFRELTGIADRLAASITRGTGSPLPPGATSRDPGLAVQEGRPTVAVRLASPDRQLDSAISLGAGALRAVDAGNLSIPTVTMAGVAGPEANTALRQQAVLGAPRRLARIHLGQARGRCCREGRR